MNIQNLFNLQEVEKKETYDISIESASLLNYKKTNDVEYDKVNKKPKKTDKILEIKLESGDYQIEMKITKTDV